ncbi:jg20524 [Pararge aegeria aegeria]|uniref:Jg20524 protein n=1 Tax=Pararge aegeria aegeria TaxID=348720 RepID=A0A8S4S700_9NEOP|nr:jg20524 [Pararge aegeria aegeria]
MARVMMFELLWDRMKSLRMMMVENLKFCELVSDDHVELQISKLEEYMKVYNNLLDNLKYMGHASKLMVDMFYFFDGVANTMIPLVPAILAELVTIQVEKMKTHLSQQLLVCSHNGLRNRVCDALKFLELRPFKYTVWRAFSLNTSLLLGLISLCTTYTIVAIQFSHVYG